MTSDGKAVHRHRDSGPGLSPQPIPPRARHCRADITPAEQPRSGGPSAQHGWPTPGRSCSPPWSPSLKSGDWYGYAFARLSLPAPTRGSRPGDGDPPGRHTVAAQQAAPRPVGRGEDTVSFLEDGRAILDRPAGRFEGTWSIEPDGQLATDALKRSRSPTPYRARVGARCCSSAADRRVALRTTVLTWSPLPTRWYAALGALALARRPRHQVLTAGSAGLGVSAARRTQQATPVPWFYVVYARGRSSCPPRRDKRCGSGPSSHQGCRRPGR